MTERSYSPSEIAALRRAVENKFLFGAYNPQLLGNCTASRTYYPEEKSAIVENEVRTHMAAGHTAKDLYDSELPQSISEAKS